jgi:hypothetical protein
MPLQWTVSHPTRLVIAVAKDELRLKDIEEYLDDVLAAGALPYRKIFRAYIPLGPIGPLAIVAATERSHGQARMFTALAEADRPIRIFRELHMARRWLDEQKTKP